MRNIEAPSRSRGLSIGLWAAQIIAGGLFATFGLMKATQPIAELARTMPWAQEMAPGLVRLIGAIDLAGGLGLILPSITRVAPRLSVWAALGCILLQVCAITFHLLRGETGVLVLNAVLIGLSIFIYWGRSRKLPIAPRG